MFTNDTASALMASAMAISFNFLPFTLASPQERYSSVVRAASTVEADVLRLLLGHAKKQPVKQEAKITAIEKALENAILRKAPFPLLSVETLSYDQVKKELKLSAHQIEQTELRLKEIFELNKKRNKDVEALSSELTPDEKWAALEVLARPAVAASEKTIRDLLARDQQVRLRQIIYQFHGIGSFSREEVGRSLKLTKGQEDRILDIVIESTKATENLRTAAKGVYDAKYLSQFRELHLGSVRKAESILTNEQKRRWKEMIGAPFDHWFKPSVF